MHVPVGEPQIARDDDDLVRHPHGEPSPGAQQQLRHPAPFAALVIEAVDGLHHPGAGEIFGDRGEQARPESVEVHDVVSATQRRRDGKATVDKGFQAFAFGGWQVAQDHPPVATRPATQGGRIAELRGYGVGIGGIRGPTVDRHLVPGGRETRTQLLHMLFDPAEGRGQAAQPDHGDPHTHAAACALMAAA